MERKEFLKRLGLVSLIVPTLSGTSAGCSEDDDPTVSTGDCETTNSETAGPFPTKNPSTLEQVDIRSDRTGVDLSIEITIQNKNSSCSALQGAIVDIWHCDKDGYYSEYGGTNMQAVDFTAVHFLRGRQVTNSEGKVNFTSIFPGWYQGRATHIHVHIYNASGTSLLVTQIAFPEGANSAVVQVNAASAKGYSKGMTGYTYNSNDNVFADGVDKEMSTITGDVSAGFALTHTIVVQA